MLTMRRKLPKYVLARGFSLVEMMVAVVIGLIVTAGAVGLIVSIDRANSETIQATRINLELRALASVIGDEIKRARHLHDPVFFVGQGGASNGTFDFVDTSTAGCILYGYQGATLNDTSVTSAVNNYEAVYLQTTGGIGSIVFARSTTAVACNTAGTTLSSPQINVSSLVFKCVAFDSTGTNVADVANTSAADTATVQENCSQIDMTLTATLNSGTAYEKTIPHTYVQQLFIRSGAAKTG